MGGSYFSQLKSKSHIKPLFAKKVKSVTRSRLRVRSKSKSISGPSKSELGNTKKISENLVWGFVTKTGRTRSKPKKHNQDNYIITPSRVAKSKQHIFTVLDGHGAFGHTVSGFLRTHYHGILQKQIDSHHGKLDEINCIKEAMRKACQKTDHALCQSGIDISFSGSTCTTVFIKDELMLCLNIGDSRAVLGNLQNGFWQAIPLSKDHKPEDPEEYSRIIASGGYVRPYVLADKTTSGPQRVWVKGSKPPIPGLAMSRSFGDYVAQQVGVSAEPDIQVYHLTPDDKFVVLASDGVWEFLSNEKVIEIVMSHWFKGDADGA